MVSQSRIIDEATEIVYFMRGAIQYHDIYETTYQERIRFNHFIEKRLKDEAAKPPTMNKVY